MLCGVHRALYLTDIICAGGDCIDAFVRRATIFVRCNGALWGRAVFLRAVATDLSEKVH
jgi:hypothetical protein